MTLSYENKPAHIPSNDSRSLALETVKLHCCVSFRKRYRPICFVIQTRYIHIGDSLPCTEASSYVLEYQSKVAQRVDKEVLKERVV